LLDQWAATARPKREVRDALAGERPRLVVIGGSVAVDDDIRAQLRVAGNNLWNNLVAFCATLDSRIA
jgi:hypothetical protein